ncbi:MAG: hypothetical protein ABSE73_01035 [Planctomycetota bacterium]
MSTKEPINRVQEDRPAYGVGVAGTVTFDLSVLAKGEQHMEDLLKKAAVVSHALKEAGVPHAVIGGLAVRAYLGSGGEPPSLTTRDLDILLRRADIGRARQALEAVGFMYREVLGLPAFIPPGMKYRDGVHVVLSEEKVKADSLYPCPTFAPEALLDTQDGFTCLDLRNLVFMKLTSFRPKDQSHLQDLLEMGLITAEVQASLPADLQTRLQQVVEQNRREGRI